MVREALRSLAPGCPGQYLADLSPGGTHTADESDSAGKKVVHYNSAFNGKKKNQALAALHLMRISEPSLKFQRL